MATQPTFIDDNFRAVTPEEIASYQKFGWVKLNNFIPRAKVDELLAMAKDRMGENGDRNLPPEAFTYFNPLTLRGLKHPLMGPIIEHCGHYAASASDRSGGMVFWTALTDMPAEKGTMEFLNGSHRFGVMGHYATYGQGNLLDSYPELLDECASSGNLIYSAGDVTVHSNMTVHSAGTNVTDDPRWTYIVIVNPADACWNGGPADAFQTDGLTLHKELDDERFPIIG